MTSAARAVTACAWQPVARAPTRARARCASPAGRAPRPSARRTRTAGRERCVGPSEASPSAARYAPERREGLPVLRLADRVCGFLRPESGALRRQRGVHPAHGTVGPELLATRARRAEGAPVLAAGDAPASARGSVRATRARPTRARKRARPDERPANPRAADAGSRGAPAAVAMRRRSREFRVPAGHWTAMRRRAQSRSAPPGAAEAVVSYARARL